jgi:hypothetical protein
LINLLITIDYGLRMKLAGVRKFFKTRDNKPRIWNWFDTYVVVTCNLMFIIIAFMPYSVTESVFDGLEETFLVVWGIWQIMRMVLIAKKHK